MLQGKGDWGQKIANPHTIEEIHLHKCGQAFGTYFGYSVIWFLKFLDWLSLAKMTLTEQ